MTLIRGFLGNQKFLSLFLTVSERRAARILSFLMIGFYGAGVSCSYQFQNSHNFLAAEEGIQKIYVQPFINQTYSAGIENKLYNDLIRSFVAHRKVTLVNEAHLSDGILSGMIMVASYTADAYTQVSKLNPTYVAEALPAKNFLVSTTYLATLECRFTLKRTHEMAQKKTIIWNQDFRQSRLFPASNQVDVPGTTSPFMNESEFERALFELSKSMMNDVHESMLALF